MKEKKIKELKKEINRLRQIRINLLGLKTLS